MELFPLLLVVASAVSHAFWNLLAKESSDKEAFMWLMSFTSLFTVLPVFLVLLPSFTLSSAAFPYLLASGFIEALYFLSLGKAYETGDLSLVYPLARSSPLILFVLAVAFLGERVSPWGVFGIALVVQGVYMIHLKGLTLDDFAQPVRSLRDRASQWALLTAFWTSLYSLVDKMAVTAVNPVEYAFWLDVFIVIFLTPPVLWRRGWGKVAAEWRERNLRAMVSGFLMRFGYILVLVAMSQVQVSYVISIRQLSVVIGAFLGVWLLGEKYGRFRLISSAIIFTGVFILGTMT